MWFVVQALWYRACGASHSPDLEHHSSTIAYTGLPGWACGLLANLKVRTSEPHSRGEPPMCCRCIHSTHF